MNKILFYPKDATLYQGLQGINKNDNWFTDSIEYACKYAQGTDSVLRIVNTKDYLKLLNLEKVTPQDFDKKEDIKITNGEKIIYVSMRELFQVLFGRGCKKNPQIKTYEDLKDLENNDKRFEETQYGKFYRLTNILGKGQNKIKFYKLILKIPNRFLVTKKSEINRLSDWNLDLLFFNNLKKKFKNIDGFYAPNLQSDWNVYDCNGKPISEKTNFKKDKCKFYQPAEIALFNEKRILELKIIEKPDKICKYM